MSGHKPLGGRILTVPLLIFGLIAAVGVYFMAQRFIHGMGAVSNLNGGYPWGVWVVYDIVVGTGLACGGYALAFTVYIFNGGKYHPLVRPALLASLFGYALGGFSAIFDMGRWWQFYNMGLPWHWNLNSVLLEVGLCVFLYVIVLAIEFSPAFFERIGATGVLKFLDKFAFLIIAFGVLLPTMHQSSLGSLMIAMGHKIDPLWQSLHFQPLLAVISALVMGYSIVVFEGSLSGLRFGGKSETPLLSVLGKVAMGLMLAFVVIRLAVLAAHGKLGLIFAGDFSSLMFLLEMALFLLPVAILASPTQRAHGGKLLIAAVSMVFAGSLYRFNAFLFAYDPGPGYSYFPSAPEIMITLGIISIEILAYLVIVKTLPVLHRSEPA